MGEGGLSSHRQRMDPESGRWSCRGQCVLEPRLQPGRQPSQYRDAMWGANGQEGMMLFGQQWETCAAAWPFWKLIYNIWIWICQ